MCLARFARSCRSSALIGRSRVTRGSWASTCPARVPRRRSRAGPVSWGGATPAPPRPSRAACVLSGASLARRHARRHRSPAILCARARPIDGSAGWRGGFRITSGRRRDPASLGLILTLALSRALRVAFKQQQQMVELAQQQQQALVRAQAERKLAPLTYGSLGPKPAPNFDVSPRAAIDAGQRRRLWRWYVNMALVNFVEFSAESSRGVVLATLFLYTKSLGGDLAFMGLLTSLFSVGRLISSTVFGWMCDHYSFKSVYLVSSAICLLGNAIYVLADPHVSNSLTVLAVSRFLVGFGAGNRSVCRANVAAMTTINQRLKYLTILATVVFLGYALTPGLGSLVANTDSYFLGVHFNKYTSPGMILVLLNVMTIVAMVAIFDESIGIRDGPPESPTTAVDANSLSDPTALPDRIVNIGAIVFIILNFNARGILSVFETVNIPLFLQVTGSDASSASAVIEASNFQFYLGLLGLVSYFSIEYFRHSMSDVNWVQLGFSVLLAGNVLLVVAPETMSFFRLGFAELLVWSIGCPITTAVVLAAFSKLLGGRPQGTLMGLLGSAASVSRIVLPLLPAALSTMTPVFWINIVLCAISIASLWWYARLVYATKQELINDPESGVTSLDLPNDPRSPIHAECVDYEVKN